MLDKIVYVNANMVCLIFTHRPYVTIRSSEGNAYELYLWMNTKTHLTFEEFLVALKQEDTNPGVNNGKIC